MKRLLATAAVAALGMTGLGAGTANADTTPAATSEPASEPAVCATGRLPAVVHGTPASLRPGTTGGDYLWHDAKGWHLAVTHATHQKAVFTGTIISSRPITYVKVRDEKRDLVRLSADRGTLAFRFVNYGYLDGLDFGVDCAKWVHFSFRADGRQVTPTRVFLGARGVHPTSNPFAVERR